tara:strand:- start:758 stop:1117 length:360 start_codon:yes stop_codon:yes gene_type:complete
MEINGKIIELLEEKSGESAKGPWRKQEYILETDGQYPKKVCFMAWTDKIDEFAIKEGENLVVSIDLESREYNGRWYTDVKAWQVKRAGAAADNTSFSEPEEYNNTQPESLPPLDDEIPF